ncbi:aldose 1-epimerase [Leptospira ilyithenensis]|uniref:Aldose 1-epimerase n=1 Tax=Leptospira ilyithenensis TaxID=2484901 RepID=A0A4R9LTC0_9LEPT|nr:aldose 1-epimerase [Leptospira ilyithenensis]TGN16780.1 aldose 1-epimerase [Leptospira ilyithenensis]
MYRLKTKKAYFDILPDSGGQWINLILSSPVDFSQLSVIAGYKSPDPFFASGSFLMFPWVNRLKPNPWAVAPFYPSIHWLTDGNGVSLHGLFHNLNRKILSESHSDMSSIVSFGFELPVEWKNCFLESIDLTETYILTDHELKIRYQIENHSEEDFSFALGIHPYFRWGNEENIDDLYLFGTGFYEVKLGDYLLPEKISKEKIRLEEEVKLEGKHYDSLFMAKDKDPKSSYFGFFSMNRKEKILVGGGNFYQVYIPGDRKSIAIEPMTSTGNFLHFSESNPVVLPKKEQKTIEFFIRMESF